MDVSQIIEAYGLPGLMIVGLGYWILRVQKRNDDLVDRGIEREVSMQTTNVQVLAILQRLESK